MENVVVVGAGIIGTAAAWNLARQGFKTHLIDAKAPGNGCSFGNAGLIAVDHVAPLASPETVSGIPRMLLQPDSPLRLHPGGLPRMASWMIAFLKQSRADRFRRNTAALASLVTVARAAWDRVLEQNVLNDLFRDIGSLYVFEKAVSPESERRYLALLDQYGVEYENLSATQVRERFLPALTPRISHARYFPGMASVTNPQRVVERLFHAASSAGMKFTEGKVEKIEARPGGKITLTIDGHSKTADKVLIAAGFQSKALLQQLGTRIALTNERGYHVQLADPGTDILTRPVSFVERGFTCNPMAQGIRLAGTVELGANGEPNWRRAEILARQFKELFPAAPQPTIASRWHGERPTLPDYLPMIGELPGVPNVFVATGHQHLGLTLGPLTGELASALISRRTPAVDLAPFSVSRF